MSDAPKNDASHQVLSDMADQDAEQPGDTPTDPAPRKADRPKQPTEDAPRETD